MIPVQVVGVGLGREDLGSRALAVVAQAQVLAGGRRLLAMFPEHQGRRIELSGPVEDWLADIAAAAQQARVVVLASGDPLCHGIGARLVEHLGRERVVIHPNLSAAQAAFARLGLPWAEARIVSLHGRDPRALWAALAEHDLVAIYTDPRHTPGAIARMLLERGQEQWRMWVLEELGRPGERVGCYSLSQAAAREDFALLNVVVLVRQGERRRPRLGAPEQAYQHQAGLITKAEVRAVALARLELGPGLTLWDLGAGCGSVGLEASLLVPGGRILAVEQDPQRAEQIRANRRQWQVAALEVVCGRMPEVLEDLPAPDRVFVGGGGRELEAVVRAAGRRLSPGGVMVAAVVRLESLEAARRAMAGLGLAVEVVQVQVSRGAPLGGDLFLKALNPVWLVSGRRAEGEAGGHE